MYYYTAHCQHLRLPAVRQWLVAGLHRGSSPPHLGRDAVGVVRPILRAIDLEELQEVRGVAWVEG